MSTSNDSTPVGFKIADAARKAGVSRRTVYNWIADGRVDSVRTPGGSQRVIFKEGFTYAQRTPPPAVTKPCARCGQGETRAGETVMGTRFCEDCAQRLREALVKAGWLR